MALRVVRLRDVQRTDDLLGAGTSCQVYKGLYHGSRVALKVFHSPGEDSSRVARSISAMAHEARVLAPLNHPNIIRCYGIVELDSSTIVLELADSGKLTDRLQASPLISITDAYTYAQQIAYGMVYLHEQGIVHCDLKGSNVLLSAQDQIKISDFGVSVAVDSTVADHGYTELWAAPEYVLATNDERRNIRRTTSYDVYSFAMVLYEIVTRGKLPFSLNTPRVANVATALKNRLRPVRPESDLCILSIWVLMNSCWAQDPNGRPSFQTIIESLKSMNLEECTTLREGSVTRGSLSTIKGCKSDPSSLPEHQPSPPTISIESRDATGTFPTLDFSNDTFMLDTSTITFLMDRIASKTEDSQSQTAGMIDTSGPTLTPAKSVESLVILDPLTPPITPTPSRDGNTKLTSLLRAELLQLSPECIDPLDPLGCLLPTALPLQLLPPKIWNVENVRLLKNHGGRCGVIAELVSSHNSDPNTQMKHLRSLRRFDEFRIPSFTARALLYHEDGNLEMAAKLYETPAADDDEVDPIACNNLAVILQRDTASIRRAEELYRKARRCMHDGRPDMYATVNLGLLLVQEGFDMIEGRRYLSEAADKGFHEASIALACIHYVGHGVEPSVSRAEGHLTRSADENHTAAANLGILLLRKGPVFVEQATSILKRAEENSGHAKAVLGLMAYHGYNPANEAKYVEAVDKLRKSNTPEAKLCLGLLFQFGFPQANIHPDSNVARKYFRNAGSALDSIASSVFDSLLGSHDGASSAREGSASR